MNEDEATNLQKEKDLKKKKKIKRTFIDTMGKKNETIKKRKRKRNYSHDWFQNEETNKMKMRKKKKDAAFFDPDSFCFLLLVCTHYDLSQFIVLSMKYCNKNTVNYS